MKKRVVTLVIFTGLIILIGFTIITHFSKSAKPVDYIMSDRYDRQMIDFTLKDRYGEPHTVTGKNERPKLINFWTSWCTYCKAEAQELNQLYATYHDQIEFVSVNVTTSDTVEDAQQFIETYQVKVPAIYDIEGKVASQYRVMGIPTNYFIRSDGRILAITEDITSANADALIQQIIGK